VRLNDQSIHMAEVHRHEATKHGLMRVVDEPGEDYLYPLGFFGSDRTSTISASGSHASGLTSELLTSRDRHVNSLDFPQGMRNN
jgi:hypothetical protein